MMYKSLGRILRPVVIATLLFACNKESASGKGPAPAAQGVDNDGTMHPGPDDRCPVCAMTVHDKKFPAALQLEDNRTFYFCGPGCMIRSWTDPQTHLGTDASHLKSAWATEYFSGKSMDANRAVWIVGSDLKGPMGPMPVAVEDPAAAEKFKERHGGKETFQLKDMTADKWQALRKKTAP